VPRKRAIVGGEMRILPGEILVDEEQAQGQVPPGYSGSRIARRK
jgi:hypothetical protein